jgi:hypothetical protein
MKTLLRTLLATSVAAAAAASATPVPALDADAAQTLERLARYPESAGTLIYRGRVVPQAEPGARPLFTYERRVDERTGGLVSSHITTDLNGEVIIAEQARMAPGYTLRRFDAANRQQGYSGSVIVSREGRHLEFTLVRDGKVRSASEDVKHPVVSGPSLHGFVLQHWDRLAAGEKIPVRMIILNRMETYGFDIRRQREAEGRTTFSITPSSPFVRLVVAPLVVTFDSATRNVVRYEGRVPPMKPEGGRLVDLDARVDYTMNVPAYR